MTFCDSNAEIGANFRTVTLRNRWTDRSGSRNSFSDVYWHSVLNDIIIYEMQMPNGASIITLILVLVTVIYYIYISCSRAMNEHFGRGIFSDVPLSHVEEMSVPQCSEMVQSIHNYLSFDFRVTKIKGQQ